MMRTSQNSVAGACVCIRFAFATASDSQRFAGFARQNQRIAASSLASDRKSVTRSRDLRSRALSNPRGKAAHRQRV
jgi:hypothetical protein